MGSPNPQAPDCLRGHWHVTSLYSTQGQVLKPSLTGADVRRGIGSPDRVEETGRVDTGGDCCCREEEAR